MHETFFRELGEAVELLHADPTVHVILIWSDRRVFSAGLDLQEAASNGFIGSEELPATDRARRLYSLVKRWQGYVESLHSCPKPVLVACHGAVIGGAIDLITAADIRLCSKDAYFSIAETRVAIVADLGTLQRIEKIVGPGMAREMAFTSENVSAERALQCGLVTQVFDDRETLLASARKMADGIAIHSPRTVQGTKLILNHAESHSLSDSLDHVALYNTSYLDQPDLEEVCFYFNSFFFFFFFF